MSKDKEEKLVFIAKIERIGPISNDRKQTLELKDVALMSGRFFTEQDGFLEITIRKPEPNGKKGGKEMQTFAGLLKERKILVDEISQLKEKIKKKEAVNDDLLAILQKDMLSLSDLLIDVEKKKIRSKFLILGWIIKDSSSSEEIHIEFQLAFPLMFPGEFSLKKDGEVPFIDCLKRRKVNQKIQSLSKKYQTKFIFTCKARA